MKLSEAVKSHIEICRPLRQTDSPNAPRTVASSPRRLVDLALVTQNRGFDPMDLEITVFILYNKKEKSKRIHIVRWEACLRKTERAAIRRYGQPARTAPAYTPEQQRRRNGLRCAALFLRLRTAPRTGLRPRAGWLRLRAGAPTRRAAFGSLRRTGGGGPARRVRPIPSPRGKRRTTPKICVGDTMMCDKKRIKR